MDEGNVSQAAKLLAAAWKGGQHVRALPEGAQPRDFAEAAAIQDRILALIGEQTVGYKVVGATPDKAMWGTIVASRLLTGPARLPATSVPLLGIEAEIAYRLDEDVPVGRAMTLESFSAIATPMPVIEIVDSRFADFANTPELHRAADLMSSGALVCGAPMPGWPSADFSDMRISVTASGAPLAEAQPGWLHRDVRATALSFLNAPHRRHTVPKGAVITTGSLTGIAFAQPGDTVEALFDGFGSVAVSLEA